MDDRQLLELAAKAADIRIDHKTSSPPFRPPIPEGSLVIFNEVGGHSIWNPLEDDGDALRLAVKLHITIDRSEIKDAAYVYCDYQDTDISWVEDHGDDPCAATRRAITRAAAGIQLTKESK